MNLRKGAARVRGRPGGVEGGTTCVCRSDVQPESSRYGQRALSTAHANLTTAAARGVGSGKVRGGRPSGGRESAAVGEREEGG